MWGELVRWFEGQTVAQRWGWLLVLAMVVLAEWLAYIDLSGGW